MRTPSLHHATAFISSTFADMSSERDLMMYHVLPKIKKWAFDRGILFDIVDLRWGINNEQAMDLHHTIKICLKKVQESDPLFICFVGERYGWIPEEIYFNQSMFQRDISKYAQLSATELEIAQALNAAFYESLPKSCLFLLRDKLDMSGVPKNIREIYVEDGAQEKVAHLRATLEKSASTMSYRATPYTDGGTYKLTDFTSEDEALEEVLVERIKTMLTAQYALMEETPTIQEDVLIRQQYHLRQISNLPRIESCQAALRARLEGTNAYEYTHIGIPRRSSLQSQIAQLIEDQQCEGRQVIYRFFGIDPRMETPIDLITSIAYELSGSADYLENAVEALYYVKEKLEHTEEQILLLVAGIPMEILDACLSILVGLKFHKSLLFIEVDNPAAMPYHLTHSAQSFEGLAEYLFEKHAKVLTPAQMERVLSFADGDDALLQTVVTYLCTFATYDTLDSMLAELEGFDKRMLTDRYVDQLIAIQNSHEPAGIMELVLELLCHSPLPITEADIVDVICTYKTVNKERVQRERIQKEVAFSLAFARDFIVEYNSRFKIYDDTVRFRFMSLEIADMPAPYNCIPTESALSICLRNEYISRLWSEEKPFDEADARNLLEITKDYSSSDFRKLFCHTVMEEPAAFYKLAHALGKRGFVDLMKTHAMQSLDMNVESYYARALRCVLHIQDDSIGFSQSIMDEKLFSVSRRTHPDNLFLHYYGVALALNACDLSSPEKFKSFLDGYVPEQEHDTAYHVQSLPKCLHLTPYNFTAYTVYDINERSYQSYFCHCGNGMAIICDAITGELRRAYAIPYCGEIISTFYQERTVHIVSDQGILIAINMLNGRMELHRFAEAGDRISAFSNNYQTGYQFAAVNGNAIAFYRAIVRKGSLRFHDGWTVQSVYGLPIKCSAPERLAVTLSDPEGNFSSLLIDLSQNRITFAFRYNDRIVESIQNELTGEIYLRSDQGLTYILRHDGGDGMEVDVDTDRYCYAGGSDPILENEDGIFYDGHPVTDHGSVLCGFGSRKFVGFVTDDSRLYLIDNGY